jgi:hypothetical protein
MTTTNTGAPDAIVYSTPPFGFRVVPPAVPKHAGEVFTILNASGVTVHVAFPVLQTDPPQADVASLTRQAFIIDAHTATGAYEYHVEIKAVTRDLIGFTLRASADSDPRIIID